MTFRPPAFRLQVLLIIVLAAACYANSLLVPLQLDDDPTLHVVAAEAVSGARSLPQILASPRGVAVLSFALNLKLHGERVLGFHLFNLGVHLAAALLVLALLRRMFSAAAATWAVEENDGRFSFLAAAVPLASALLFACHPIQTQAVTYISQRYTSLAACLYLASLYAFFRARLAAENGGRRLWGCGAVLFALTAMNSKEIAFTLPVMMILLEALLFRGRLLKKRFTVLLGAVLLLVVPFQVLLVNPGGDLLQSLQRATAETDLVSRHDYFLTQLRVVVTYLRLLLVPVGQNLDYDYPLYRSLTEPRVLASLALHLGLAAGAVILIVRSRPGRQGGDAGTLAAHRLCAVGICWFYLALAVESSFIPIRDYIYEHRLYLPSVGFFLTLTTAAALPAAARQKMRRPFWLGLAFVVCLLSAATIARNRLWQTEMTLWQDALAKSPGKARPYHSIGKLYFMRWKPEQALPFLLRAIELEPSRILYRITLNHCVGIVGPLAGRTVTGEQYEKGRDEVDRRSMTTWLAASYNNIGLAYEYSAGNLFLARRNFEQSVAVDPQFGLGWYNLALIAARQGDRAASAAALERLRVLDPALAAAASAAVR